MLYWNPVPTGAVTVICPVATVHVGCTSVVTGAAGALGTGSRVAVALDVHPAADCTVIMWLPGVTPANTGLFWSMPLSRLYW